MGDLHRRYKVNDIFLSLQGEGANQGMAFVFVRFSGCNLACPFCDTDHEASAEMTAERIFEEVRSVSQGVRRVLFTGGEPALQLDAHLLSLFGGWYTAIETNGTLPLPKIGINYIACSPKNNRTVFEYASEVRYTIKAGDELPRPTIYADNYFLSPIFDGGKIIPENVNYCVKLCEENPEWRLSVQLHKLIGIK